MYPCDSAAKFLYCVPVKTLALKLASLLMEYLLANGKLDLPGIGTFSIDKSYHEKTDPGDLKPEPIENIGFENDPSIKENADLISFISSRTSKMKSLVAADLDSHLNLAREFLNIGKPFLFEGIGSLSKLKSGQYEFIPEKQKDTASKEITITSSTEESFTAYEKVFSPSREKSGWKKPLVIFLLLAGFGIAIWLGYLAYKNRSSGEETAAEIQQPAVLPVKDSIAEKKDSLLLINNKDEGYKFILEVANKTRAFKRYDDLKSYGWEVQLETKDSIRYKLFLLLDIPAADTTRVMDSLTILSGRKVYLEK